MALIYTFTAADGHWIWIAIGPPNSNRSVIATWSYKIPQIRTVEYRINLLYMSFKSFDRLILFLGKVIESDKAIFAGSDKLIGIHWVPCAAKCLGWMGELTCNLQAFASRIVCNLDHIRGSLRTCHQYVLRCHLIPVHGESLFAW